MDTAGNAGQAFEERVLEEIGQVKRLLEVLAGEIGRLKGRSLEQRVRDQVTHYLRGVVSGARVVELEDVLARFDLGAVDPPDLEMLEKADLLAEGMQRDGGAKPVHIVAEISWRVNEHDVRRAHDRARILATGAGRPALAAVIADDEPDAHVIAVASALGVAVIDGDGIVLEQGAVVPVPGVIAG